LTDYERAMPARLKLRGAGLPSRVYVAGELAQVRLALAELGANDLPAADLGVAELRRLTAGGAKGSANPRGRFGVLSRFLDWAVDAEFIPINACSMIGRARRPKSPQARANYLSLQDLARLWRAADGLREPVWRDFARFLIAVPCRRGEAAHLDWAHLDVDAAEWRQPGQMTKNSEAHRLHLHPLALGVLADRRTVANGAVDGADKTRAQSGSAKAPTCSGLVFPGPASGRPLNTFSTIKRALS
jgi:integrase